MAAVAVGGAFLSATLQVLFDRMASPEVLDFIRGRKVPDNLLVKLETSCLALNAVLNDAEEKEISNPPVKKWLDELRDAVCDAEDLLDEIATEALQCQLEAKNKVRNCIPVSFNRSGIRLKSKIEEVIIRLEDLAKQKDVIGLRERVGGKSSQKLPTTSLIEDTGIYGCEFLVMLPTNMRKLVNLRHLDISRTSIMKMPIQMGGLKRLRTLTKFIVDKDSGFQIEELGELSNLRGTILISKLQNVINPMDVLKAKLKVKRHIEELTLEWDTDGIVSQSEREVLNHLLPHTNLKRLFINSYSGTSFPSWVGDRSFTNITVLHLKSCRCCPSLPSLGQLPSLQDLSIVGFDKVVRVGPDFYGSCSSAVTPFASLRILKFEGMLNWEEWLCYDGEHEQGGAFLRLQDLYLVDCPKLSGSLPKQIPSLSTLVISNCSQLETSLPSAPAIRDLQLMFCNEVLLKEMPPKLNELRMEGFHNLESLLDGAMDHNHCLEELIIGDCPVLKFLPHGGLLTSLKKLGIFNCKELQFPTYPSYSSLESLDISHSCNSLMSFPLDIFPKLYYLGIKMCRNMESLSVSEGHHLDLLVLEIEECPNFVDFPSGGLPAPNLTRLKVTNCPRLVSLPQNMHMLLPSLQSLYIKDCPQVDLFPEGGLPTNLNRFVIDVSEKLFANRMDWGLQRLCSLQILLFSNLAGDCQDVQSFPEENLLPTSLSTLGIAGFPNLRSLDKRGLQHLTSLEELWIKDCPKLKHMPAKKGLPMSISHLQIRFRVLGTPMYLFKNHHPLIGAMANQKVKWASVQPSNILLLECRKDNVSEQNLQIILNWYCSISGQSINLAKSDVFCSPNMPLEEQQALARTLQVNLVQQPSKYRDTISNRNSLGGREGSGLRSGRESASDQSRLGRPSVAGDWQIIIKIVNSRSRKFHRYGTVYEGLTVQGEKVFFGAISSTARTSTGALLEAMLEAVLTAKSQGFQHILVLSNSRSLMQTYRHNTTMDWLDSTRLTDLRFLNQNGVCCNVFWVPTVVVKDLRAVACLATRMPMHFCWFPTAGPTLLYNELM
ncbi:hypothetical protein CMV_020015 [Castanea mollissima]|uniref:Rx N-terminal domain-containing protein n=1 Tax=Castanea mollissima TaxID=60419 RepID=A0A8J4QM60_9ROSI|nr:hypothetical protein CMV_020015 [Castanea mollissima]